MNDYGIDPLTAPHLFQSEYRGIRLSRLMSKAPRLDMDSLQSFVAQREFILPDDYVDFLKLTNGGFVDYRQSVSFQVGKLIHKLHTFYSFVIGRCNANPFIWEQNALHRPPYLFEIAIADGGGRVLVGCQTVVAGRIFYVDDNIEIGAALPPGSLLSASGVSVAAESFGNFIDQLNIVG